MTPVCVLRSGGDFRVEHVQRLAAQVPGLVCLSDVEVPGVELRPLVGSWPGWWAKMEAFSPELDGDILLMDLDTLVLALPEVPRETTVLPDFYRPELMGSGFMYLTARDRAKCWGEWIADPEGHMRRCRTRMRWGDQGFLQDIIGSAARWGKNVVSWKIHCRGGIPPWAEVVCFHGTPRPWEVGM